MKQGIGRLNLLELADERKVQLLLIGFYRENETKEENNAPSIFALLKKEKKKKTPLTTK